MENKPAKYRIRTKEGKILNAGSDSPSWFNLDKARELVNYDDGQTIIEHDGLNVLWEVF